VDRLFAPFEATDSASQCDHTGETLAGALFRFMMLDEHVLCHSLARACYSKGGGGARDCFDTLIHPAIGALEIPMTKITTNARRRCPNVNSLFLRSVRSHWKMPVTYGMRSHASAW